MNTSTLLRAAAIVSLLFAAGHTLGGRKDWSPMGDTDVLKAMRAVRFDTMGVSRTYLEFYRGFGYSLSVFLLLQTVVLWQMAAVAKTDPQLIRPMVATFAGASVATGVISWLFLFPVPAIFSAILATCLGAAFVLAG
jgi:hypothetical protein